MGVCSRRTQRLSGGAGSGAGRSPFPGGAGLPPAPAGTGTPGKLPRVCSRAAAGPRLGLGSCNLLAVNKALPGDDAPARLKRPEQSVNETFFIRDYRCDTIRYDMMKRYGSIDLLSPIRTRSILCARDDGICPCKRAPSAQRHLAGALMSFIANTFCYRLGVGAPRSSGNNRVAVSFSRLALLRQEWLCQTVPGADAICYHD